MPNTNDFAEINKRLGIVIALLLKTIPKNSEGISLRDQVQLLSELGVRPKDIAAILGRSQTYVTKELSGLRKGKAKTKRP
jgi:hypothetical protein